MKTKRRIKPATLKRRRTAGSLERVAIPRLIAKWKGDAKDSARELGATIDAVGRAELEQMQLTYKVCARELERTLARYSSDLSSEAKSKYE